MIVGRVVGAVFSFSRSVCSAGISRVLIKYSGKYVRVYFNMKITFYNLLSAITVTIPNLYESKIFFFND